MPPDCVHRISVEAGVTQPWYRYVGRRGKVIGIDRFGLSAPGPIVLQTLGISVDAVIDAGEAMLARE